MGGASVLMTGFSKKSHRREVPPYASTPHNGKPWSIAINSSITASTFPNNAKIVSVVPIDRKADDKYVISYFRPVSILNCFSEVYENVIKNKLLRSMNFHLSPFISAYRKNYNTQHVLLSLLEE